MFHGRRMKLFRHLSQILLSNPVFCNFIFNRLPNFVRKEGGSYSKVIFGLSSALSAFLTAFWPSVSCIRLSLLITAQSASVSQDESTIPRSSRSFIPHLRNKGYWRCRSDLTREVSVKVGVIFDSSQWSRKQKPQPDRILTKAKLALAMPIRGTNIQAECSAGVK